MIYHYPGGCTGRPETFNTLIDSVVAIKRKIFHEHQVHVFFFPAYKMMAVPPTPIETLKLAEDLGKKAGLKYIHLGNI